MNQSKYGNSKTDITSSSGGSLRLTIPATPFVPTVADTPCRYCRVQVGTSNSTAVRVRIGATCTDTTGVAIPAYPVLTPYQVDNLNKLNFLGATENDVVDIEYFE